MTRTMYDSVHPELIPASAEMVAGYDDGAYTWTPADWARFPNAVHVHISATGSTYTSSVLDVERYDATPQSALNWVLAKRQHGDIPSVYCNQATWVQVMNVFHAANKAVPLWWCAKWDGLPEPIPFPAIAKQYQSTAQWDISSVADNWPGVDPVKKEPVVPQLIDNPVDACLCPTGGSWVLGADGGVGAYGGAPFHGSYPGLPAKDREGTRTFLAIEATAHGYAIIANDGSVYRFRS